MHCLINRKTLFQSQFAVKIGKNNDEKITRYEMIKFTDVSFGFPQKDLYNEICFEIVEGDHAALIGSNGTGKSTLIDMIINTDDYLYDGKIEKDEAARIGYIPQFVKHETEDISSFDFLAKPFVELQQKSEAICAEMENAEDMDEVYGRYQKVLDEMDAIDAYNYDSNIRKELAIAGMTALEDTSVKKISGGEFKLLAIIKSMLLKPQLLIMDEPDVFLDFENIIGLSKLINNYEGTIIAISHNRLLLSQCFNKILHLENMELQEFPGTFAEYNQAMLETKVQMAEQATKDAEWIAVQEKLIEKIRAEATYIDNPAKGRQLKARVSYLERLQARQCKNPFIENHGYDFTFPEVERPEDFDPENAPVVISVKDYALSFDRELLKNVSFDIKAGEKVAIVGANGTGKSSMLKDIYESMKSDADRIGYYTQIFDDDPEQLSGGERNIKQLRALCESDAEILFLDEPSSHLDTYAQIALEKAIKEYKGTVLMVTHDFYTVANCADRILLLENGTVREQSGRAYRKSIYKKYFESDIFEAERIRVEREVRINALLRDGKWKEAKNVL